MTGLLHAWIRRDPERPIRVLFASDFGDLAGMIAFFIEHLIKRPVTLVEYLDLADLVADARQFACDMIFIWRGGHVTDRERPGWLAFRDCIFPRVEQLRSEFPGVPVILVAQHHGPEFPGQVAAAGAHLLKTPFSFEDLKKGFETWRSLRGGL